MESNINEVSHQLKAKLLGVMQNMTSFVNKYPKAGLPKAEEDFYKSKALLEKGEFIFAICGKVKSGKSSLINALIGRELLPVNSDVATSCVYKISHSETDMFFVVYDNGDRKQIEESQLAEYGSQANIDALGLKDSDKVIAYIEVNTKLNFLPQGVSIMDTPGIGSTYPLHTTITQQYIKMADAVLYVVNATPLEDIETAFLQEIAGITNSVMFVMTKIDLEGQEAIEENSQRIIKQVNEIVENGIKLYDDVNILKMSSKMLMDAAKEDEQRFAQKKIKGSHFADVKAEMLNLVFLTQGYYRVGLAFNAAVGYYQTIYTSLHTRLDGAKSMGENYTTLLNEYENARLAFNQQFGEASRKEIFRKADMLLSAMDDDLRDMLTKVVKKYISQIDGLCSNEEIESYKTGLADKITGDLNKEWDQLTQTGCQHIQSILNQFADDCEMALPPSIMIKKSEDRNNPIIKKLSFKDQLRAARSEMLLAGVSTTIAYTLANAAATFAPAWTMAAASVINPAFAILGIGVLIWGTIAGKNKAKEQQLKASKEALKQYVREVIEEFRKQLLNRSIKNGEYESVFQGFKKSIQLEVQEAVAATYDKYKKEIDALKQTLEDSRKSPKMVEALDYMVKAWESQRVELQSIKAELEDSKWIDNGNDRS